MATDAGGAGRGLLRELIRRQKKWIWLALGLAFAQFLLQIASAQATSTLVDRGIVERTTPLLPLVGVLVVLAVLNTGFTFGTRQSLDRLRWQLEYDTRVILHGRLLSADPRRFHGIPTGQLINRSVDDLNRLRGVVVLLPLVLGSGPAVLAGIVYLSFINIPLMVLTVSAIPLNLVVVRVMRGRLYGLSWLELDRNAEVTRHIDEAVRGIRVVRLFGQEARERNTVHRLALDAYDAGMTRVRLLARYDFVMKAVPVLVRAALLGFGARAVFGGSISLGNFLVFFMASGMSTSFAQSFDEIVDRWQFVRASSRRIDDAATVPPDASPDGAGGDGAGGNGSAAEGAELAAPVPGAVLDGHRRLAVRGLHGGDLEVHPGELVVVTGASAGELSSLCTVAAGVAPPASGPVLLGELDLAGLGPGDLGRAVRLLGAEPFLFARSVRENLLLGSGSQNRDRNGRGNGDGTAGGGTVDEATLAAALHAAAADEVVAELDHGLDTVLGDRGMTVSGGQRQRLALAQALLHPPRVLVLDDALSGVQPTLETEILRRIRALHPDLAVLCHSQRPGPRAVADRVVTVPAARPVAAPPAELPGSADRIPDLSEVVLDGDEPPVAERVAADPHEPPTVRRLVWSLAPRVAGAVLALSVLTAVSLAPEYLFGSVADLLEDGDRAATDRQALMLFGLGAAGAFGAYLFHIMAGQIGQGILYILRRRLFGRLSHLGIDYFDREVPGEVAARVVYDLNIVSDFSRTTLLRACIQIAMLVMSLAVMALLSTAVIPVVLAFLVVVLGITALEVPLAQRAFDRARRRLGEVVARLEEDYLGRFAIHGAAAGDHATAAFEADAEQLRRAQRWAETLKNGYSALLVLLTELAAAAVFWRAGSLVLAGALTTGTMLSLRLYVNQALTPVSRLGSYWQEYLLARVSFDRLRDPYRHPLPPEAGRALVGALVGDVTFGDVRFTYPGTRREVARGFRFRAPAGALTAVIGPTGAGKSTLAKLLARVYDPSDGAIRVGDTEVAGMSVDSYRRRVAVVPQDAFVFSGSVAENIAYGQPEATRDDVVAAAEAVGAHAALSALPLGYDTLCGEEGRALGAAQRQLVALARAWLVSPDVLVLDEATAALGPADEAHVLEVVRRLGRTTLFITHRPQVAAAADHLVVVDAGEVVAEGAPSEVLTGDGVVATLWSDSDDVEAPAAPPARATRRRNRPLRASRSGSSPQPPGG